MFPLIKNKTYKHTKLVVTHHSQTSLVRLINLYYTSLDRPTHFTWWLLMVALEPTEDGSQVRSDTLESSSRP